MDTNRLNSIMKRWRHKRFEKKKMENKIPNMYQSKEKGLIVSTSDKLNINAKVILIGKTVIPMGKSVKFSDSCNNLNLYASN